jgi:RNA polymerase sigma-70 factor (ECF subfamily)
MTQQSSDNSPNSLDFVQIYDQYSDKIFRHLYFRTGDREKALDLMQETFTKTYVSIQKGATIEHIQAFLYHVASNLMIDDLKKQKSASLEQLQEEDGFMPSIDDSQEIKTKIDVDALLKYLDRIPPHYRQVIIMRYIDELEISEIAEALKDNENSVRVKIHRAISQLRNLLKDHE